MEKEGGRDWGGECERGGGMWGEVRATVRDTIPQTEKICVPWEEEEGKAVVVMVVEGRVK